MMIVHLEGEEGKDMKVVTKGINLLNNCNFVILHEQMR
jgi:hypothetical protein